MTKGMTRRWGVALLAAAWLACGAGALDLGGAYAGELKTYRVKPKKYDGMGQKSWLSGNTNSNIHLERKDKLGLEVVMGYIESVKDGAIVMDGESFKFEDSTPILGKYDVKLSKRYLQPQAYVNLFYQNSKLAKIVIRSEVILEGDALKGGGTGDAYHK